MQENDGRVVVQRYLDEVWKHGNIATIDELCAPSFVVHVIPPPPDPPADAAYLKQLVTIMHRAFTNVSVIVHKMTVQDDVVETDIVFRGWHRGYFVGNPPTDTWVHVHCTMMYRIADSKLVEGWVTWDVRSLARQLGFPLPLFGVHVT